jgi:hypothetical protein
VYNGSLRLSFEQHDGGLGRAEQPGLIWGDETVIFNLMPRRVHQSKWLFFPVLSPAQQFHNFGVPGVCDKMEPSKPLDGYDFSAPYRFDRIDEGFVP